MTQHRIILFRGMNTGGVRAPVAELRAMAADLGLANPRTLAASGNLVVESAVAVAPLEDDIEAAMARRFSLEVAAMVRTPEQWAQLIAANPFPQEAEAHPAQVVAMVMKAGLAPGALAAAQALARDGERVEAVGGDLFFWFPHGQGGSDVFKKATPRLLGMGTGRNWNTVLKLADMVRLKR